MASGVAGGAAGLTSGGANAHPLRLSPRERQLVQLVVDGCSNQEAAERLQIRRQTVKNHLSRIYEKVGVSTRVQLAVRALRDELV